MARLFDPSTPLRHAPSNHERDENSHRRQSAPAAKPPPCISDSIMALTVVGAPVPRAEGADKVAGRTIYAADVKLPGSSGGKILRASSPRPHPPIDAAAARWRPGPRVVTGPVVTNHYVGKMIRDMPVLCWDVVPSWAIESWRSPPIRSSGGGGDRFDR